jgi:uncharacterized protein YdaU (DUF1376 family)
MADYPAFLFYPEDFATGTAHMPPMAVGIYIRCLCHQWSHGFLPSDLTQIGRLCGALPEEINHSWPLIASKFTSPEDGKLLNKRLEETRLELLRTSRKRSRAGKRGASYRWANGPASSPANGLAFGPAYDKTMASRVDNEDTLLPSGLSERVDDAFERFWQAFPKGRKKSKGVARAAFEKAASKAPVDAIIASASEYAASDEGRGQYVKMPSTWLNGECWTDDRTAWRPGARVPLAPPADRQASAARAASEREASEARRQAAIREDERLERRHGAKVDAMTPLESCFVLDCDLPNWRKIAKQPGRNEKFTGTLRHTLLLHFDAPAPIGAMQCEP